MLSHLSEFSLKLPVDIYCTKVCYDERVNVSLNYQPNNNVRWLPKWTELNSK